MEQFNGHIRHASLGSVLGVVVVIVAPDEIAYIEAGPQAEVHAPVGVRIVVTIGRQFTARRETNHRTEDRSVQSASLLTIVVIIDTVVV